MPWWIPPLCFRNTVWCVLHVNAIDFSVLSPRCNHFKGFKLCQREKKPINSSGVIKSCGPCIMFIDWGKFILITIFHLVFSCQTAAYFFFLCLNSFSWLQIIKKHSLPVNLRLRLLAWLLNLVPGWKKLPVPVHTQNVTLCSSSSSYSSSHITSYNAMLAMAAGCVFLRGNYSCYYKSCG